MKKTHRGPALVATATTLLATTLLATTLLATALPAQAVPSYRIDVGSLDRGPAAEVPVLVGKRIHDGDLRLRVTGYASARLMGTVGDDYVVQGVLDDESTSAVSRLAADGVATRLVTGFENVELSDDGTRLALSRQNRRRTIVKVLDTADGSVVAHRRMAPWSSVLDVDGRRVVTGSWEPARTRVWRYRTDRVRVLKRQAGQLADLSSGVFSVYAGDPYRDGCTTMARFGSPRRTIWRNCNERVIAISPGGKRMLTTHILADGPGPVKVTLRRAAGRRLASFRASGLFGETLFEDDHDALLDTAGRRRHAWVRASEDGVERVTRLRRQPPL